MEPEIGNLKYCLKECCFQHGGHLWTPKLRRGTINSTAMVMAQIICQGQAGEKTMGF